MVKVRSQVIESRYYDAEAIAFVKLDQNQGQVPIPEDQIEAFKAAYVRCPTGAILRSDQPFTPADLS